MITTFSIVVDVIFYVKTKRVSKYLLTGHVFFTHGDHDKRFHDQEEPFHDQEAAKTVFF